MEELQSLTKYPGFMAGLDTEALAKVNGSEAAIEPLDGTLIGRRSFRRNLGKRNRGTPIHK
ncbi:MAG: hypothetical protein ACREU8_13400 [Gammaproteobacteria bacterium]